MAQSILLRLAIGFKVTKLQNLFKYVILIKQIMPNYDMSRMLKYNIFVKLLRTSILCVGYKLELHDFIVILKFIVIT